MRTNKSARILALLMVAVILLTCVAYATDLKGIAEKVQAYISGFFAILATIGVLWGAVKLAMARNFTVALITLVFGLSVAYLIGNPAKASAIINATLGNFI